MKKITAALVSFILLFSSALAESDIAFQDIPWLSDDAATLNSLSSVGLIRDGVSRLTFSNIDPIYIIEDDVGFVSPDRITGAEEVTFVASLADSVRGKIAGYPVKDLILSFAYDGEYRLISVKVELINASYDELKAKLLKVYGEGDYKTTDEGIDSIVWKGENNSAVVLYTQNEGASFTLVYGRLDASEILAQCLEPAEHDNVSGL